MATPTLLASASASGGEFDDFIDIALDATGASVVLLKFGCGNSTANLTPATVTYNGVAATFIGVSADSPNQLAKAWMYIVVSPATGSHTAHLDWTGSQTADRVVLAAEAWSNVDTTTPTGTAGTGTGESGTASATAASGTSDVATDVAFAAGATTGFTTTQSGQTSILQTACGNPSIGTLATSYRPGQTTTTAMGWTLNNGSLDWGQVAVALKASGGGGGTVGRLVGGTLCGDVLVNGLLLGN